MPGFDGTGPFQQGSMTGKGRGCCGFGWRNAEKFRNQHNFNKGINFNELQSQIMKLQEEIEILKEKDVNK